MGTMNGPWGRRDTNRREDAFFPRSSARGAGRVADLSRLAARGAAQLRRYMVGLTVRRVLGLAGTALLGGALAWSPIAAFTGEMLTVTKAALVGVALLIVMWLLPRRPQPDSTSDTAEHRPDPLDDEH